MPSCYREGKNNTDNKKGMRNRGFCSAFSFYAQIKLLLFNLLILFGFLNRFFIGRFHSFFFNLGLSL